MRKYILAATIAIAIATLTGCASERDNRTLAGAGIGGVIGNVLGGGSTSATVGGAVVGGVIGNQTARDRDYRYNDRDGYRHDNGRHRGNQYRMHREEQRRVQAFNNCLRAGYSQRYCHNYVNR